MTAPQQPDEPQQPVYAPQPASPQPPPPQEPATAPQLGWVGPPQYTSVLPQPSGPPAPATGAYPQVAPAPSPLVYTPPPPMAGVASWRLPIGPVPFALSLVGVLLLGIALLLPFAKVTRSEPGSDFREIFEIPFFGSYFGVYDFANYSSLGNLDLLPSLLTLLLLAVVIGTTGTRRTAARIATAGFGLFSILMLIAQFTHWRRTLLDDYQYTEGLAPSDDESSSDDEFGDDGFYSIVPGLGMILAIAALLMLIAAAVTAFERRTPAVPAAPTGHPMGAVPQQPGPAGLTVTPDRQGAPPGQWQHPVQ